MKHKFINKIFELSCCNPFSRRWIELEQSLLGKDYVEEGAHWHSGMSRIHAIRPNIAAIVKASTAIEISFMNSSTKDDVDQQAMENLVLFNIFHELEFDFLALSQAKDAELFNRLSTQLWRRFLARLANSPLSQSTAKDPKAAGHIFSIFFQMRRAFDVILSHISGSSWPLAQLRSRVWESIFTHDLHRYRQGIFRIMGDIPTLITGPSGSGKELVAKAIGLSRYIPFIPQKEIFCDSYLEGLISLNLSAFNPTLVEAELFGHAKGAFTGAHSERKGWLERCPEFGSVFLDEIGDVSPDIQVKLLRVLQNRTFCRVGETQEQIFHGKIIAATHKDLLKEIDGQRLRHDFYYRLCADVVVVPSLHEILNDQASDLKNILKSMAEKMLGPNSNAQIAEECEQYILENIGAHYPWPGNFRELEQCLRSFIVHRGYMPPKSPSTTLSYGDGLWQNFEACTLSLEELNGAYLTRCYEKWQNLEKVSQIAQCDRRTVKAKLDQYSKSQTSLPHSI